MNPNDFRKQYASNMNRKNVYMQLGYIHKVNT